MNLRKQIDCTNNALKGTIFNQYEEMCRRNVIIQSTLDDLKIKLNIIGKELQRCSDRSKFVGFKSMRPVEWDFKPKGGGGGGGGAAGGVNP